MTNLCRYTTGILLLAAPAFLCSTVHAQAPEGPQSDAPAPATSPASPAAAPASSGQIITVPTGTRLGVVLENGISTATAKPGDSVYFRTSFPITINNKVVIPVGSYMRGEVLEAKRSGHIKGKAELRIKLNSLVFPNGYTVDMNAEPHSTDAAKVKTDDEGKMTGPGGKGKDAASTVGTVASTAGAGAIIGGLGTDSAKGAAIGAGIGGAAGLAAILLSRGPDTQLPRGSSVDLVLERDIRLDADQIRYTTVGQPINTVVIQQPASSN
jgi:hypothetical protein